MTGTLVNISAIAVGSLVGLLIRSRLPQRIVNIVFQGLGLVTIAIGVAMSLKSDRLLLTVVSIIAGAVIGEALRLEERLERGGERIKKRLKTRDGRFMEGFVTASMIFCVGSMSILGAIEDGMGQEPRLLFTKAIMDGTVSIALASSFGAGVLASILPVLLYQGAITFGAQYLSQVMSQAMMADLTCVGGVLLIGLGLHLLGVKKISVVNMLPALVIVVLLSYFLG